MRRVNSNEPEEDDFVAVSFDNSQNRSHDNYNNVFETDQSETAYILPRRHSTFLDIWAGICYNFQAVFVQLNDNHPRAFTATVTFLVSFLIATAIILNNQCPTKIVETQSTTNTIASNFYASSNKAAVATDVGACSNLGKQILSEGGNAMDAAVTAVLCLGVLNPASSGLGGGCFILNYNASTHDV